MRIVLDTNVLISACWKPGGLEAQMVEMVRSGRVTTCVSEAVCAEYRDVLFRAKFAALRIAAEWVLQTIEMRALRVQATESVHAATDDDDNRFLECAVAAQARYLITGNLKHYPKEWCATRIVNAREFLDRYAQP